MAAAEEGAARQRRGVRRHEHMVPGRVHERGLPLCEANRPQSRKTTPSQRSETVRITASVNSCQPMRLWEAGVPACTVRTEFSRSTPCRAQGSRSGLPLIGRPRSSWISLKMFFSEGGAGTPSGTEKQRPIAWPGPWYGSWPRMTTFTSGRGVSSKALKIWRPGG